MNPPLDFDDLNFRGRIQLVGMYTTATLPQNDENWKRIDDAVADGRLLATESELIFKVASSTERRVDQVSKAKRVRLTPLVRPSQEGSGRASTADTGFDPRRNAEAA